MSFDWWPPEYTATCFIIVTIVEIHMLIIDVLCLFTKMKKSNILCTRNF